MTRRVRRIGRRAGRGALLVFLTGGWALLAAMPVGAALLTWFGHLG